MAHVVTDYWSVARPDMRAAARKAAECEAWSQSRPPAWEEPGERAELPVPPWDDEAAMLAREPSMILDWDGKDLPDGGPIARLVAKGSFPKARKACEALAQACGLPVVEAKFGPSRIELRMSAPLRPGARDPRWTLA